MYIVVYGPFDLETVRTIISCIYIVYTYAIHNGTDIGSNRPSELCLSAQHIMYRTIIFVVKIIMHTRMSVTFLRMHLQPLNGAVFDISRPY